MRHSHAENCNEQDTEDKSIGALVLHYARWILFSDYQSLHCDITAPEFSQRLENYMGCRLGWCLWPAAWGQERQTIHPTHHQHLHGAENVSAAVIFIVPAL